MISVPLYAYVIIAAGWLIWFTPFPRNKWNFNTPQQRDRRARWGILLQVVAYSLLWQGRFWTRTPEVWRTALCIVFFALASWLSWTGVAALGRHLRFDAALGPDHELVRSGPYRVIRHPIYTSMFCMLLGTGCLITPLPLLLPATVIFLAGTEIRVRIEDGLLA